MERRPRGRSARTARSAKPTRNRRSSSVYKLVPQEVVEIEEIRRSSSRVKKSRSSNRRSSKSRKQPTTYYMLMAKDLEKMLKGKPLAFVESRPTSRQNRSRSKHGKEGKHEEGQLRKKNQIEVIEISETGPYRS